MNSSTGGPAGHQIGAVLALHHRLLFRLVLTEGAGDGFENVAEGDDAFEMAVFVIDEDHMQSGAPQVPKGDQRKNGVSSGFTANPMPCIRRRVEKSWLPDVKTAKSKLSGCSAPSTSGTSRRA